VRFGGSDGGGGRGCRPRPLRDRRRRRGVCGAGASTQGYGPPQRLPLRAQPRGAGGSRTGDVLRGYRTSAPFAATPRSGTGCRGSRFACVTTRCGNDAGRRRMFRWRSWPRRSRPFHGKRPFRPIGPRDPRPGDVAPQTGGPAGDHAVRTRGPVGPGGGGVDGWSETRVKVRAFRARQALKRHIGGDDER